MKMKKGMAFAAFAAMTACLVGMSVWCARLNARVRELEEVKSKSEEVKSKSEKVKSEGEEAKSREGKCDAQAVTNAPLEMKVVDVAYDQNENYLDVELSERPDMENIRHYVSVSPMEGFASVRYRTVCGNPYLRIRGEFAFRTNVTLRIAKGLPLYGKGRNPNASGSLKEDFVFTFRRKDKTPYVAFAADGRYLPPGGKRAIEIESVNVSNVLATVRRVEPRNVVQMLAREEGEYSRYHYWRADNEETEELSGEPVSNVFRRVNRPNEKEFAALSVDARDGKPANGIYLVSIINVDRPRKDWCWYDDAEGCNRPVFRLVCLSDLGLSVRKSGTDELGVWVTSLTTGRPVADAWIDVYSSANVKVMEGRSDAKGWCATKRIDKGEPFAVVVISPEGDDMAFMALRKSMEVDETCPDGAREGYLKPDEARAFLWTDRGIYRHGEKIFVQAIVRNGARTAPKPFPLELELRSPQGNALQRATTLTDAEGTVRCETFAVPSEQPSGIWKIVAKVPGKDGKTLGEREVKIEEFAPPQIRVKVAADEAAHPTNFGFAVSAEHLFGGPADGLCCRGAVVFEDVAFAPRDWKGWRFGNDDRGLKPCFREIDGGLLDTNGTIRFAAPLWADSGLPKAAVRATGQGIVFEDGGRPATMRASVVGHYYPYYIGSTLPGWLKREQGRRPRLVLACVTPDGRRVESVKRLTLKVEQIDSIYSYHERDDGWHTWDCERLRTTIAEGIAVTARTNADTVVELPIESCGDYAVTVEDPETHASFGRTFYLSDWGDETVRAPLADPTAVTLVPDKSFYRAGEVPRLTVRAPFTGYALISVLREKESYTEVVNLTNATSEVCLWPVTASDAPNLDVYMSVVQSVGANAKHLAVRAKGQTTICVRPLENEIPVALEAKVVDLRKVDVDIEAPGAAFAVVTVVDEEINLLTGEQTPDPVGSFATPCMAMHPLYDLYHKILPVLDEAAGLKANGVKTGGGFGAEMLGRVSVIG